MKSQTLAISLVLLLIAVAALPGLSFSLSSSVTSYNNSITYVDSTNSYNGITIDPNDKTHTIKKDDGSNEAIITGGGTNKSFTDGTGKPSEVTLTTDGTCRFILHLVCVKQNNSGFMVEVTINGQKHTLSDNGGFFSNTCFIGLSKTATPTPDYSYSTDDIDPFSGNITIKVIGKQTGSVQQGAVIQLKIIFV